MITTRITHGCQSSRALGLLGFLDRDPDLNDISDLLVICHIVVFLEVNRHCELADLCTAHLHARSVFATILMGMSMSASFGRQAM